MAKDNPRTHRVVITSRWPPFVTAEVWSYSTGQNREFHVAFHDDADKMLGQIKFVVRYPKRTTR